MKQSFQHGEIAAAHLQLRDALFSVDLDRMRRLMTVLDKYRKDARGPDARLNILVVDDDPAVRQLMRRILESGKNLPPPLAAGSKTSFDPGDGPFGLWVSNDGLKDGGVFSEPKGLLEGSPRWARGTILG